MTNPNPTDTGSESELRAKLDGLLDDHFRPHHDYIYNPHATQEYLDAVVELIEAMLEAKVQPIPMINGLDCPACGHPTLILGDGGYVTCSLEGCPNPDYAEAVEAKVADEPTTYTLVTEECASVALYMYEQWQEAMKPPLFVYRSFPEWLAHLAPTKKEAQDEL